MSRELRDAHAVLSRLDQVGESSGPSNTWVKVKNPATTRCAGSAGRRGASAARPSWFCPNGKRDKGDYSRADNHGCDCGHFDLGKASYHAPIVGGSGAAALIWIMCGEVADGARRYETARTVAGRARRRGGRLLSVVCSSPNGEHGTRHQANAGTKRLVLTTLLLNSVSPCAIVDDSRAMALIWIMWGDNRLLRSLLRPARTSQPHRYANLIRGQRCC